MSGTALTMTGRSLQQEKFFRFLRGTIYDVVEDETGVRRQQQQTWQKGGGGARAQEAWTMRKVRG